MKNLDAVFTDVSDHFIYQSDQQAWGCPEYWAAPNEDAAQASADGMVRGDCDDFALLCREKLDALGVENHLVFCQVETGEYHLVCESGGYILDCRQSEVLPRDWFKYRWIALSGVKKGDPWHEIL